MTWSFLPSWNGRWIVGTAVVLLLLAAWRWRREGRGSKLVWLRVVILLALLAIAANPESVLPNEHPVKPKLIVLLDTSASMATTDVDGQSRLTAAAKVLGARSTLESLEQTFTVDLRQFDRDSRILPPGPISTNAIGDASDVGAALLNAVSSLGDSSAPAAILLISDGRATAPGSVEAAQFALARSAPVWTWCVGGAVPRHDLWMETASSEVLAFNGAEVELAATLHEAGYPNRSFKVEVLQETNVIDTREVVPDASGVARVSLHVKAPAGGEARYLFRVAPQADEADTSNNERAVFVRTVGEKVNVLVAEGQPHWDTKFLVQSLKRDPRVNLTAIYRLNAARTVAVVSSTGAETRVETDLFPRSADTMNAFDVIIFGRGAETFFDNHTESLLTDYTAKRGGSVVFARGKSYDGRFPALARLEPLAWGDGGASAIHWEVTDAGRDNPMFDLGSAGGLDELLGRLPPLDQVRVTLGEKPLAVVLAASAPPDGPVLLAYQRYGLGRALSLNADGLWRWAFRENGQAESEEAYQRFWISLLQWLLSSSQFTPGSDVALLGARRYYTDEQPMQFLVATRNLDRTIYRPHLAISGNGKTVEIEPRPRGEEFAAEAGPFAPGIYQVTLRNNVGHPVELTQTVEVKSGSIEKRELSADPDLMQRISEASGGAAVSATDIPRLGEIYRHWQALRQISLRQEPLWDRWWVLTALIGLLGAEWWLRRKEGLL